MIQVIFTNICYSDEIELVDTNCGKIAVTVEGHALFKKKGLTDFFTGFLAPRRRDVAILCSSVSVLTLNLLRSMTIIGDMKPVYDQKDGFLRMELLLSDLDAQKKRIAEILLESYMIGILDIRNNYPGSLDIRAVIDTF